MPVGERWSDEEREFLLSYLPEYLKQPKGARAKYAKEEPLSQFVERFYPINGGNRGDLKKVCACYL